MIHTYYKHDMLSYRRSLICLICFRMFHRAAKLISHFFYDSIFWNLIIGGAIKKPSRTKTYFFKNKIGISEMFIALFKDSWTCNKYLRHSSNRYTLWIWIYLSKIKLVPLNHVASFFIYGYILYVQRKWLDN
jgi:hypothetical protein